MVNPHLLYCIGFFIAIILYALGWSDVYPPLSLPLSAFISATLLLHFALSRKWKKANAVVFYKTTPAINPIGITIFIYALWIADFIYEGGVPLIKILTNQPYDYRLFGVPSLHVLAVTFSSFYILYLFHTYISNRNKLILILYLFNSAAAILIYSRSMLFFNLTGSAFIYLFSLEHFPIKTATLLFIVGIGFLYFFGVVGNKRIAFEAKKPYNSETFLEIGRASNNFRDSGIPKEFFWSYIYISSPLANLQANIRYTDSIPAPSLNRTLAFINNEILFESISKRINKLVGIEREKEITIKDPFNVSTIYSRSYSYLGWTGMIIMAAWVLILPWAYFKMLIADNPYRLTGLAILCTVFTFLVYDNTIRLMALGFQLVYPLAMPWVDRVFKKE